MDISYWVLNDDVLEASLRILQTKKWKCTRCEYGNYVGMDLSWSVDVQDVDWRGVGLLKCLPGVKVLAWDEKTVKNALQQPVGIKNALGEALDFLDDVKKTLQEKNKAYGDSAANPLRIFSKSDKDEAIKVRIDDKLSRIAKGDGSGNEDAIKDLVGYLALLAGMRK